MALDTSRKRRKPANSSETNGLFLRGQTYWVRFSVAGTQHRQSLGTSELSAAIERAKQLKTRFKEHALKNGAPSDFTADILRYLADKQSEGTFTRKSAQARHDVLLAFSREMGAGMSCATITVHKAQVWYDSMRKDRASATMEGYIMWLRAFFNYAVEKGWCARNPIVEIKKKVDRAARARVNSVVPLSKESLRRLIENAPSDDLRFILLAGGHAGMRKDEIISAQPHWFNLQAGTVTIQTNDTPVKWMPKWGRSRTVPLTRTFLEFLKTWGLSEPYVLRPEILHGQDPDRYDFDSALHTYLKREGFPQMTSKVLRHSYGSIAASAGTNLFLIQQWMGHSSIRTTERHYLHLVPGGSKVEGIFD